jgi:hypothetical protein
MVKRTKVEEALSMVEMVRRAEVEETCHWLKVRRAKVEVSRTD